MRRSDGRWLAFASLILLGFAPVQAPSIPGTRLIPTLLGYELASTGARLPRVRIEAEGGSSFEALIDDRVLVQLQPNVDSAALYTLGLEPLELLSRELGIWAARDRSGRDSLETRDRLLADPRAGNSLRFVEPNYHLWHQLADIPIPPDDPRYPGQWYLERIGVESAWALNAGSPETTIVVIDNGCDLDHPDLATQLDEGRDVIADTSTPTYEVGVAGNNHGTACAGVVGAAGNNAQGIVGVCPGCRLRCVQLLAGRGGFVSLQDDIEAFEFARSVGAAVISNSWNFSAGTAVPELLRETMLDVMANGRGGLGTVVVFAVGNESRLVNAREIMNVDNVVGVGALTLFDEATSFSNRGRAVDVVAPAGTLTTDIVGPDGDDPGEYTNSFGGTSSACPVVAGVAGLLVSAKPDAHARDIEAALIQSVRPAPFAQPDETGWDPLYGYGIVDPAAGIRRLLGLPDPTDAGVTPGPDAASTQVDTGVPEIPDAGTTIEEPDDSGCHATSPSSRAWFVLLLGALLIRRRPRS